MAIVNIRDTGRRANELMREIGITHRALLVRQARLNKHIQTLKDREGPAIDALSKQLSALTAELVELVVPSFALLVLGKTKTIRTRNGEISLRFSPEALFVEDDENKIIQNIRRKRGATRFLRRGKVTLDKRALKADPAFVARIRGLRIGRNVSLIIKPSKTQGEEIVLEQSKLSVTLPQEV